LFLAIVVKRLHITNQIVLWANEAQGMQCLWDPVLRSSLKKKKNLGFWHTLLILDQYRINYNRTSKTKVIGSTKTKNETIFDSYCAN